MANTVTRVDLIRHGEPVGGKKYRGQTDDPLSAEGEQQMRAGIQNLGNDWDIIISSPLQRCLSFARSIAHCHGLVIHTDRSLVEIGFGCWEGKTAGQIPPAEKQAFYNHPLNNTPVGAEPVTDFRQRVEAAWQQMLSRYQGKKMLWVTHAGIMRMLYLIVAGKSADAMFSFKFDYAETASIDITGIKPGASTQSPKYHWHGELKNCR